jgi:hypothetical protein
MSRFGVLCIHIFACGWTWLLVKTQIVHYRDLHVCKHECTVIVKLPMVSDNPNPWRTAVETSDAPLMHVRKSLRTCLCLSMLDFFLCAAGVSTIVRKILTESGQYLTVDVNRC